MKRVVIGSLVGVAMLAAIPLTLSLMAHRSYAQTSNSQVQELEQLLLKGVQQTQQRQALEAIETFQRALAIARKIQDRESEAWASAGIGLNYDNIGKPREALNFYGEALIIFREMGDRAKEATTLNDMGVAYSKIDRPQEALKYLQQALSIWQEVESHGGKATTLNNIGQVYSDIGQPQEALKYYQQALTIWQEVGGRGREATTLNGIGAVYSSIGQFQEALKYYQQALTIWQKVDDPQGEAMTLNNIGQAYSDIGKSQEALKYFLQSLPIRREVNDRRGEAITLNNMGVLLNNNDKPQEALEFFLQALPIRREVGDRGGEATTLNNIGTVYNDIEQPHEALKYFLQALPIMREVGDRGGEATTLNNIGEVYSDISQPQEALKYFLQALPTWQEVGDRGGEFATLSNMGLVYRNSNQLNDAINSLQKSVTITLEMRAGLQQQNRKVFLQSRTRSGTPIALVDLLIDQNQPNEAFKWYNLATTFDLADYTRLLDAKVTNPQAQQLIDEWQQNHQRLQYLYARVEDQWTPQLSQQLNQLTAETNQLAEAAKNRYPEVAEIFETSPQDIDKLKANIPPGTLVIQPALLTGVKDVPDSIAIFLVSRDKATLVKKVPIDPQEFDRLLTEYRAQLQNPTRSDYDENQEQLYDYLIRPVEAEIAAASPKRLAIIATGKLRYIPFETLYDAETDQYLLEKYPIHYLTRISANRPTPNDTTPTTAATPRQILAFGNPTPAEIELQGAEVEAKTIVEILSGELFIRELATLATFQEKSPRFTLLHLATHGCFQKGGCPKLDMEANTILFANGETFNIADAARLGLENTDLIALSACQTAMKADSNGEEFAGVAYLFERAGAAAVMASLWDAEDGATKQIMVEFYQNVKGGMSKVDALRQAKLSQVDVHPFYWSPLILIGDGSSL
jgi:CHAT domain-containing protein/Tfp pilus assembly protein PilF